MMAHKLCFTARDGHALGLNEEYAYDNEHLLQCFQLPNPLLKATIAANI